MPGQKLKPIIIKSLKQCCISNAFDGTENDTLFGETEDDSDAPDTEEKDEPPTDTSDGED